MRVFVNGLHAVVGGGRSILWNFLQSLPPGEDVTWVVLAPDSASCAALSRAGVEMIDGDKFRRTQPSLVRFYLSEANALISKSGSDVVLNLGDIPLFGPLPQLYLFDWPYAVYPESEVWQRLPRRERWQRAAKLFAIKAGLNRVTLVAVQTEAVAERFRTLYPKSKTVVVPNAVAVDHVLSVPRYKHPIDRQIRLLCLSHYYSHKNLEVLLEVADVWRRNGTRCHVSLTIDAAQNHQAGQLLREIDRRGLADWISTINSIQLAQVPGAYAACDGLILPTLLESFSGTYLEAMTAMRPVFTSDRDFARAVCGRHAYYFDPHNPAEIASVVAAAYADETRMVEHVEAARRWAQGWPDWPQVSLKIIKLLRRIAKANV